MRTHVDCEVCLERPVPPGSFFLCRLCGKSYDKANFACPTTWTAIEWAAKRAPKSSAREKALQEAIEKLEAEAVVWDLSAEALADDERAAMRCGARAEGLRQGAEIVKTLRAKEASSNGS